MATRRERRQARTQGRLRYGPEQQGLNQLRRQARRDLLDTTASQNSAADAIVGSARQGRREIGDIYEDAGLTDAVRGALGSNPAARRLAEEMAGAQVEMRQREVDAREGALFAIQKAQKDYRRDVKDIDRSKQRLRHEKGLFVSDLLQQLVGERQAAQAAAADKAADREFQLFKQDRQALLNNNIDPNTGKPLPGSKPSKKKPKATGADREASASIGKAKTWLARLDNDGFKAKVPDAAKRRAALGELLTAGDQASGVPALPQHLVEAALDMHFAGRLSPATVKMLRSLGIQVKRLPGVTFGPRPGTREVVQAPGANGQLRPG